MEADRPRHEGTPDSPGALGTTSGTTTLSTGMNPAKVAERLGHDLNLKTLLSTYAHVTPNDDRVRAIVDDTLGGSAETG